MIKVFGSKVGKEELEQVEDSIKNQWLGAGPKVKEFEELFRQKINASNFLMIDNASNGLYLACKLLNLPTNSEIILPSFTWIACAHAIVLAGCKPVFCDVDYHTQNVTAQLIEQHINKNTGAIMVVHYAGLPVDMDPILEFGIPIIEDAAHAVDSFYKGKHCGAIGRYGIYSFDSMKNLAIGEGGGITCHNKVDFERANELRLCGMGTSSFDQSMKNSKRWWEQQAKEVFIKMKPSDIMAGFGLAQLSKLDDLQELRKETWNRYQKELMHCGDIELPSDANDNSQHSYFTYCIKTNRRDELAQFLYENGVYTTLRFYPIHLFDIYNTGVSLKNSEKISETALNIPLHPDLSQVNVDFIIHKIQLFFS